MPKPLSYFFNVIPAHLDYEPLLELRTLYGDYLSGFNHAQLSSLLSYCALSTTQFLKPKDDELEHYAESIYAVLTQDEKTERAINKISRMSPGTKFDLIPFLYQLIKELN